MTRPYKPLPTQERLQELFEYSVVTGHLTWKAGPYRGRVAGRERTYAGQTRRFAFVDKSLYSYPRLVWMWVTDADPEVLDVDHIDCDPLHNAWHNLRLATRAQNLANLRKPSNNTSGFKGACWDKNRGLWLASIRHEGKHIYLGRYTTPEEAHAAYVEAAHRLKGEFARAA